MTKDHQEALRAWKRLLQTPAYTDEDKKLDISYVQQALEKSGAEIAELKEQLKERNENQN